MDFDFGDVKKTAEQLKDDVLHTATDAAKKFTTDLDKDYDDEEDHSHASSVAAAPAAQLLDFHSDAKIAPKKLIDSTVEDFEHVDPEPFMSQFDEKIDSKAAEVAKAFSDPFDDFLGKTKVIQDHVSADFGNEIGLVRDGLDSKINSTLDFMAAERGGGNVPPKPKAVETPAPFQEKIYDDFEDDSPSVSYNPSPIKKNPVAEALKETDNEKFISSEDLLGDFRDERTATPEFVVSQSLPAAREEVISETKPLPAAVVVTAPTEKPIQKEATPPPTPVATPAPVPAPVASVVAAPVVQDKPEVSKVQPKVKKPTEDINEPEIVSVEEIFYKYGLDTWFKPDRLHPRVESLIYWRDVKKSGVVFGAGLVSLLAVSCFSVISVFAYLSLISLTGTIVFRIYKTVMAAVQKTSEGHPFKEILEIDLTLSQDKVQQICSVAVAHVNGFTSELRRLFLVEDFVDSLKFGVILWVLTYIGAWFNGMTLVILAFVSLFTLPKVYENNKQSIDTYLDLVRSKVAEITDKVKVAIPIGKKTAAVESEKDK